MRVTIEGNSFEDCEINGEWKRFQCPDWIMVWGSMYQKGIGRLRLVNWNPEKYVSRLENFLILSFGDKFGDSYIYRWQWATDLRQWRIFFLKTKWNGQHAIQISKISKIYDIFKKKMVFKLQLKDFLQKSWTVIAPNKCENRVRFITDRIRDFIKTKEENTRY